MMSVKACMWLRMAFAGDSYRLVYYPTANRIPVNNIDPAATRCCRVWRTPWL